MLASTAHYALTLTLKPRFYKYHLKEQVRKVILKWPFSHKFTSVVEITKKQNIHLHCYFQTINKKDDIMEYIADCLRDPNGIFGFYDLKELLEEKDIEKWKEYMFKEIDKTIRRIGYGHIHDNYKICSCNHGLICLPYLSKIK